MERVAVFAHYDKDCIIDDYVIYYLEKLKEISKFVVFVSCAELSDDEKSKLDGVADYIIAEKHDEYDFGSYKRGYLYLHQNNLLSKFDELIFANDSCYGPFFSLENIFCEMREKNCDFWGLTLNKFGFKKLLGRIWQCKRPHLQSYFVVFNQNVFLSKVFVDFVNSIKQEADKKDIIMNYEIGMTETLTKSGFSCSSYVNKYFYISNSAILRWRELISECKMPLMKCSLARLVNWKMTIVQGYWELISSLSDYPVKLIDKNVERLRCRDYRNGKIPVGFKRRLMSFISVLPFPLRKACTIIIYRYMPFLLD